jgi:hypothetical protein
LDPGEAEVGELHASFAIDEDVTGGDIAMKHTVNLAFFKAVRVAQGRRNTLPDPHDLPRGEATLASKASQVDPINELEDHVGALRLEIVIEDIDEVSVMKVAGDSRFSCKELSISPLSRAVRMKHLQAPPALGAVVPGPHDFVRIGGTATSDLADHSILIDRLRDDARPARHAALPLDVFFQSISTQDLRAAA